jgi:hypothetical protein
MWQLIHDHVRPIGLKHFCISNAKDLTARHASNEKQQILKQKRDLVASMITTTREDQLSHMFSFWKMLSLRAMTKQLKHINNN